MASQSVIQVLINVKDNASKGIRSVGKSIDQMGGRFDQVKKKAGFALAAIGKSLVTIGKFGLIGAAGMLAFGVKSAFSASKINELTLALHAVAKANNVSNKTVDDAVNALRGNNIAWKESLISVLKLTSAGIDLGKAMDLSKAAKNLGIGFMGSSKAMDLLVDSIVTGNTQQLANLGITTTQTLAFDAYAKKIGKSTSELNSQERQLAILNIVLKAGAGRVGAYEEAQKSASKQFASLTTRILPDFIIQIGKAFEPSLAILVKSITAAIQSMSKWLEENQGVVDKWGRVFADAVMTAVRGVSLLINFLVNNKEIIIGILGAFVIGIVALGVAFVGAHIVIIGVFAGLAATIAIFAKIWNDNWGGIRESVATIMKFIEDHVIPGIDDLIGKIKDFTKWVDENQDALKIAAGVIVTIFAPALFLLGIRAAFAATRMVAVKTVGLFLGGIKMIAALARFTAAGWAALGPWALVAGGVFLVVAAVAALTNELEKLGLISERFNLKKQFEALPGFLGAAVSGKLHEGTDFSKSGRFLVGERGPEIVDLPGGSQVTPNNQIQGGGDTFNITLNVGTLIDSDTTRRNFVEKMMQDIENIATMKGKKANLIT